MTEQHIKPLSDFAHDETSSGGEDGIIQRIFEIIGAENKWCVELGALDGVYDSNTLSLIQNHNWSAVLIEGEPSYVQKLQVRYQENKRVHAVGAFVEFEGKNSLDAILGRTPIPQNFDLLILDVDGNDYHLWKSLVHYRPRVVIIEFNPTIPNDIDFVQPRDMRVQQGSSLHALNRLAEEKGYKLITTTRVNAFFVDAPLFEKFGIADSSLDVLHTDTRFYTRMFQLYDGTIVLDGYKRLLWHKLPLTDESVQVLPKWKRKYPAGIHPSSTMRSFKQYVRKMPLYPWLLKLKQKLYSAR